MLQKLLNTIFSHVHVDAHLQVYYKLETIDLHTKYSFPPLPNVLKQDSPNKINKLLIVQLKVPYKGYVCHAYNWPVSYNVEISMFDADLT